MSFSEMPPRELMRRCRKEPAFAVLVGSDPAAPVWALQKLSQSRSAETLRALCKNPNTPKEILFRLGAKQPQALLENPALPLFLLEDPTLFQKLPAETLCALLELPEVSASVFEGAMQHPSPYVHAAIAARADLPEPLFGMFPKEGLYSSALRQNLAKNPKTPSELLSQLSGGYYDEEQIQRCIASHPNASPELVSRLMVAASPPVRQEAARHPNAPAALLRLLQRAGASSDLAAYQAPDLTLTQEELRQLVKESRYARSLAVCHPNAPSELIEGAFKEMGEQGPLAECIVQNPNAPAVFLEKLARSGDLSIRVLVAQNPNAPRELLTLLRRLGLSFSFREVGRADPTLSWEELGEIVSERNTLITRLLVMHPSTPFEWRISLAKEEIRRDHPSFFSDLRASLIQRYTSLGNSASIVRALRRLSVDILEAAKAPSAVLVRRAVAWDPETPAAFLEELTQDPNSDTRMAVAQNPAASVEQLTRLSVDRRREVRLMVASHPKTPPSILQGFCEGNDPMLRAFAAKNPSTPAGRLELLARAGAARALTEYGTADLSLSSEELRTLSQGGPYTRYLAARHPKTPPDTLASLSLDREAKVVWAVLENPSLPREVAARFLQGMNPEGRRIAAAHPNAPRELLGLYQRLEAKEALVSKEELEALLSGGPYGRWLLAKARWLPAALQERLSRDEHFWVRSALAKNEAANPSTLAALVLDRRPRIRALIAERQDLSFGLMERLAEDQSFLVRLKMVANPKTPPLLRELFLRDPDRRIRREARRRNP